MKRLDGGFGIISEILVQIKIIGHQLVASIRSF
jgi:hypothetical protein